MNDKDAMSGTELGEKLLQAVCEMKAGKAPARAAGKREWLRLFAPASAATVWRGKWG